MSGWWLVIFLFGTNGRAAGVTVPYGTDRAGCEVEARRIDAHEDYIAFCVRGRLQ